MKAKKYELVFIKRKKEASNVYSFYFNKPNNLKYNPGQYFKVNLDIVCPDDRGTSRFLTLSSSPDDEEIVITTKILNSSFKNTLHSLKKGGRVSFFGPIGYFDIDFKNKRKKVFLAGGIGITPFRSILKSLKSNNSEIILVSSHQTINDLVFEKELRVLEKNIKKLKVHFILTKEKNKKYINERISKDLIMKLVSNHLEAEYFIVGSIAMEEELLNVVLGMGVDREKIFTENFTGY